MIGEGLDPKDISVRKMTSGLGDEHRRPPLKYGDLSILVGIG